MADKRTKVDSLHDQMPAVFGTRVNPNWKAIIEAIGTVDQDTLDLIESVRQQFFIKTADRPYLDRLGAASSVQRPRFVGMDDPTFREFIPVMSYQPKQVKLIMDKLLDIFFFKESTTSFISSGLSAPFNLTDGWELEYTVDSETDERIEFTAAEFTDINNATANEVVASINRQSTNSFAIAFENSITKLINIRIFTNTVGSKGSISIDGGRADIGLQFDGFNLLAGTGVATEWTISTIGDTVTMEYTGTGGDPNIDQLQVGDIVIIDRTGNEGSFVINAVDSTANTIEYTSLFATDETFTESATDIVKFTKPFEANVYLRDRRALVWQVNPGEIIVEMPPTPPVVQRRRIGSAHINGISSPVTDTPTLTSLELANSAKFPVTGGRFFFIPMNEISTYHPTDMSTDVFNFKSKLSSCLPVYTYTSRTGDVISGISPALPTAAETTPIVLTSADRDASNTITVTTSTAHDYGVGNHVIIEDAVLGAGTGADVNGTWKITAINSTTEFEVNSFGGPAGAKASTGGTVRIERLGTASAGSLVILTSAQIEEGLEGPILWDVNSDFVLSSLTADLSAEIKSGTTNRNVQVDPNQIPDEEGRLVFDYGTEKQEGPIRYFYKPNSTSLALDPAYVFQYTHDVGSSVTMIRRRGGIVFGGLGDEYGAYITDPAAAREVLQELMEEVKSVGIFINFLVRYPEQFYATIDVYRSGIDPDSV